MRFMETEAVQAQTAHILPSVLTSSWKKPHQTPPNTPVMWRARRKTVCVFGKMPLLAHLEVMGKMQEPLSAALRHVFCPPWWNSLSISCFPHTSLFLSNNLFLLHR